MKYLTRGLFKNAFYGATLRKFERSRFSHSVLRINKRNRFSDSLKFFEEPVLVNNKRSEYTRKRIISEELMLRLEQLSLVKLSKEESIKIVEDAITFADQLEEVNTEGVEPLYCVLENETLYLREDIVRSDISLDDLLSHAKSTSENFYSVPVENMGVDSLAVNNQVKEK